MKEKLQELAKMFEKSQNHLKTEEATKHSLVLPFLQALGYNIYDPTEIIPEYVADFGIKSGEKVDYAIIKDGKPVVLIECKHWEENLAKHKGQLTKYFSAIDGKKIAILTNGYQYQFFSDTESPNKLDTKPFMEFDIRYISDNQIAEILKLHKSKLDMDSIIETANILKYTNALKGLVLKEISDPSIEFTTYLARQVYEGRFSKNNYAFFEPLVKDSLKQVREDIINNFIEKVKTTSTPTPEPEHTIDEAADGEKEITTTSEEIEGYNIVRAIACSVVPAKRIKFKDVKSYFGINLDGNIYKTFCRLRLEGKIWYISILEFGQKKENLHEILSLEDIYNFKDQILEAIKSYEEKYPTKKDKKSKKHHEEPEELMEE
jgi:hypothetical protein